MKINIEKLRVRRAELHMTQADVAEAAGTSQNHYSNIENGLRMPKLAIAANLAKALKLDLLDLLVDDEDSEKANPTQSPVGQKQRLPGRIQGSRERC